MGLAGRVGLGVPDPTLSGSAASKGATICIEECMRQQGIASGLVDEGEGDASAT